ncbi:MAG: hypothetical protein ACPL5F_00315 [Moorellaceae bacterium]
MLKGEYWWLGVWAAALAWAANRFLLSFLKFNTILWGPLWEETLKTGLALAWGAQPVLVHITFGLVEGFSELYQGKVGPAAAAVAGHSLFGAVASLVWQISGQAILTWLGGLFPHLAWNAVIFFLHRKP